MIKYIFRRKDEITINRGYGILSSIDKYLSSLDFDKIFIVTSKSVNRLWGNRIYGLIKKYNYEIVIIKSSEKTKDLNSVNLLYNYLLEAGATKNSLIVSFGGGVVMDIVGFVASTIFRGVKLLNIPTTLMSQLECAVGIKYGINTRYGKNCIGSLFCPSSVLIDFELLSTSSNRDIKSGIAEGIKYALCYNRDILNGLNIIKNVKSNDFYDLITRIIKLKINKENAITGLMYGHELGHALEILSNFSLTHGEAISIGMSFSAFLSNYLGFLPANELKEHIQILEKWDLPIQIPAKIQTDDIADSLFAKKQDGKVKLMILEDIAKVRKECKEYIELDKSNFLDLLNNYRLMKWKN